MEPIPCVDASLKSVSIVLLPSVSLPLLSWWKNWIICPGEFIPSLYFTPFHPSGVYLIGKFMVRAGGFVRYRFKHFWTCTSYTVLYITVRHLIFGCLPNVFWELGFRWQVAVAPHGTVLMYILMKPEGNISTVWGKIFNFLYIEHRD